MKMKKFAMLAFCTILGIMILTGCTTSISYTYKVETGDNVKVTLDTTDGLMLENEDDILVITRDDETILQGTFCNIYLCDTYADLMRNDDSIKIIEEDSANGITWLMCTLDGAAGKEIDIVVWIDGSDTGLLLASLEDEDITEEAFDSLTFTIE